MSTPFTSTCFTPVERACGRAKVEWRRNIKFCLVMVLEADPDGGGALAKPQWVYQYDAVGNVVRQTDSLGRIG